MHEHNKFNHRKYRLSNYTQLEGADKSHLFQI